MSDSSRPRPETRHRSLHSLPLELLAEICSYFCAHCVRKDQGDTWPFNAKQDHMGDVCPPPELGSRSGSTDLLNISRVNRTLHAVAGQYLSHCTFTRNWSLWFLLDTLTNRPTRALRIRELDVGYPLPHRGLVQGSRPPLPPPILNAVRDLLRSVRISTVESRVAVEDALNNAPENVGIIGQMAEQAALMSILLRLVPNLESAHFQLPERHPRPAIVSFPAFLSGLVSSSPPLVSLTRLAFGSPAEQSFPSGIDKTIPIIALAPNLRVLHFDNYGSNLEFGGLDLPPLQNLTELSLDKCCLTMDPLVTFLAKVGPNLSRMRYRRHGTAQAFRRGVSFHELLKALRRWRKTLRELSYTNSDYGLSQGNELLLDISLLQKFRTLQTLYTESTFLYAHVRYCWGEEDDVYLFTSTLPSSICTLKIRRYHHTLGVHLRELLVACKVGDYPNLRSIEIYVDCSDNFEFSDSEDEASGDVPPESGIRSELEDIGASFRAAGVDFVLH
ncbi:uncharacterized protein B0H64DRAFT_81822, partial [Chaetomium fimeti]